MLPSVTGRKRIAYLVLYGDDVHIAFAEYEYVFGEHDGEQRSSHSKHGVTDPRHGRLRHLPSTDTGVDVLQECGCSE